MEWKNCKISDLGKIITGKTPKTTIKENYGGDFPFLSPSDNMGQKHISKTAKTLTILGKNEVKKSIIPCGSVCVSCIGSDLGKVVISGREMVTNQQINSIIPNKENDGDFIYYLMSIVGKELNFLSKTSTAIPIVNKSTFSNTNIRIPVNLSDQRKIAGILSALDSKIENNNKINANLEAQAQALFKSWFVDFTPFKDQPFVDSELGPIPQGWKVVSLDEVCLKITDGSHFSPKDNPKEKIPMLSVKDMRKHGFDYQSCKHITESDFFKLQKNDCVPHVNDLLVAKDGSYLKEIFLCKKEIKQAILSSIAIFRPNTKLILPEYLLHYLKQPQVLKDVRDNYVSGSAVPRIVLKDFKKLKLCIPPMNSISTYRELLKSIEQLLLQKTEENQRLAALRDTLLPKLMSGEIKL